MSTRKNPEKKPRGELPPHLKPGNPGNSGGKKGRSGRPPNEFREKMRELASTQHVESYLRKCLRGELGPRFFLAALNFTADRGYGRAPQPITGEDGGPLQFEDVTLADEDRAARVVALLAEAQARREAGR